MQGTVVSKSRVSRYSVEANMLSDKLQTLNEDEVVTYDELSQVAGIDVRQHHNVLQSAVNTLRKEQGKVYKTVRGVGIQRLTDAGKIDILIKNRHKQHELGNRSIKVANTIDFEKLSAEQRPIAVREMSAHNLLKSITEDKSVKKLDRLVTKDVKALPAKTVLEMFST